MNVIIFIPGFKNRPGKALEKTEKQPWKTLDFVISEDVRTLFIIIIISIIIVIITIIIIIIYYYCYCYYYYYYCYYYY